jgi:hypothetical protein
MLNIETTWPKTGTTPWLTVTPTTPTTKDGPEEDATVAARR